jgi:5-methylcytosine-specific restriction endonuclease McrA
MKKKKEIRLRFRTIVFNRDNHKCKICKSTENLDAHHITDRNEMPNGGYVLQNGITVCDKCHLKAEEWHNSNHTNYVTGFHPNDLYKIINSSYELAYEESLKMGL